MISYSSAALEAVLEDGDYPYLLTVVFPSGFELSLIQYTLVGCERYWATVVGVSFAWYADRYHFYCFPLCLDPTLVGGSGGLHLHFNEPASLLPLKLATTVRTSRRRCSW